VAPAEDAGCRVRPSRARPLADCALSCPMCVHSTGRSAGPGSRDDVPHAANSTRLVRRTDRCLIRGRMHGFRQGFPTSDQGEHDENPTPRTHRRSRCTTYDSSRKLRAQLFAQSSSGVRSLPSDRPRRVRAYSPSGRFSMSPTSILSRSRVVRIFGETMSHRR
jgi:hypothetical protein